MAEAGRSQHKDKRQVRSRIHKDGLKNDSSCLITDGSSTPTASSLETTHIDCYTVKSNRNRDICRGKGAAWPGRRFASPAARESTRPLMFETKQPPLEYVLDLPRNPERPSVSASVTEIRALNLYICICISGSVQVPRGDIKRAGRAVAFRPRLHLRSFSSRISPEELALVLVAFLPGGELARPVAICSLPASRAPLQCLGGDPAVTAPNHSAAIVRFGRARVVVGKCRDCHPIAPIGL